MLLSQFLWSASSYYYWCYFSFYGKIHNAGGAESAHPEKTLVKVLDKGQNKRWEALWKIIIYHNHRPSVRMGLDFSEERWAGRKQEFLPMFSEVKGKITDRLDSHGIKITQYVCERWILPISFGKMSPIRITHQYFQSLECLEAGV